MQIRPQYFIYLGLLLIILELILGVSAGFDLLLSGIALLVGGAVLWLTNVFWIAVVTTIVLILAYFAFLRTALRSKLASTTTKNVNIDKLINAHGIVVKNIRAGRHGQVQIDGEIWRAESTQNLKRGEKIFVNSVEGVTLKVSKNGGAK